VVKDTRIVLPSSILEAGLAVEDGKVVAIAKDGKLPRAERMLDAKGNLTLPGIIDVHVHFRDPGLTYKEDFLTGSMAAAAGGVTTVFDMPNTLPMVKDAETLKVKVGVAEKKSYVDFGILGVVMEDNLTELGGLAEAGVLGFKLYMAETMDMEVDDWLLFEAFRSVAKTGLRLGVHAENNWIIQRLTKKMKEDGRIDPMAFVESRPCLAEAEAVQKAIFFSRETGSKLHFHHLSSMKSVEIVGRAKKEGLFVTCETCPHYLLFKDEDMRKLGSILKITPPIKSGKDQKGLWNGLLNGSIDIIASDHSPHTIEEKIKDNIWEASSGFVGVETSLPLMLTQVNRGRLTINEYVRFASENPAKAYGIYPQKGTVQIGSDADLTIVDMKKESVIKGEKLHSKSRVTPFEGWKVQGSPIYTIVRGNVIMEEGEILDNPKGILIKHQKS